MLLQNSSKSNPFKFFKSKFKSLVVSISYFSATSYNNAKIDADNKAYGVLAHTYGGDEGLFGTSADNYVKAVPHEIGHMLDQACGKQFFTKKSPWLSEKDAQNAKYWIDGETYRQMYQFAMQGDPESMYLFANVLTESLWPKRS